MTEEIKQDAETEQQEVEPKTDGKQDKAAEKKFTDSDVAAIRRKASKELTDAQTAWNEEKTNFQSTIDAQNEALEEMVALLEKDTEISEDVKELLKEKSPIDRLKFLRKRAEKVADIPPTPRGVGGKSGEEVIFHHKISRI